ncbi:hypothetical protein CC78DRAFT_622540 [Lojkania enalia]|uniref:Uncharacterized protein n=1 Tax=Lojkania enalia TaxID=147567 RepID=A0A9P4JXD3_9PLEO|nr:hypothetical protein CC78DRAFT_622540 [Didymosphaeria enalia]
MNENEQSLSPHRKFLEPSTPSTVSAYGTPLVSPRPMNGIADSYFGHISDPGMSWSNSQPLKVPLSSLLLAHATDVSANTSNIGGWLSRSFLTGLILPGEMISHFLISTLLENDRLAISTLGDSANLYGGFVYAGKSWWSKNSIIGRVFACIESSTECMGWICVTRLPESVADGWYSTSGQQPHNEHPPRISAEDDFVARDSAIIPGNNESNIKPEDLTLPLDSSTPPVPSVGLFAWKLTPFSSELSETEELESPLSLADPHYATLTFTSFVRGTQHDLTLNHEVQFITSFPCTPPSFTTKPSLPQVLKRSLSRNSSKRSVHSTRSGSNRPSLHPSRRNSHGFEPLLSHPPDSPSMGPTRVHAAVPDEETGDKGALSLSAMAAHPVHVSYKYKTVPAMDVLDPDFVVPFKASSYASPAPSNLNSPEERSIEEFKLEESNHVLVLDARASRDLELLARAFCADRGFHAVVGRAERTCLACCVREARGLGVGVVVRV